MIDPKLLRTDPDGIRRSEIARGGSGEVVDRLLAADEARRANIQAFETMRAEQKDLGKQVAQASGDEKAALLSRTKQLSADVKTAQATADEAGATYDDLMKIQTLLSDEPLPEGTGSASLGIRNVHERVKIIYGQESGLSITITEKGNTLSRMNIKFEQDGQ